MNLKRVSENKFAALDDAGEKLGTASISRLNQERIFPDCPTQFKITVESAEEAKVLLYSASITRARVLADKESGPCRVYCVLEPNDKTALDTVHMLGFKNYDGIMRMRKAIGVKGYAPRLPEGCTQVNDYLNNPGEFTRCLKRYNECFGTNMKADWLNDIISEPDFARMMIVDENGLCSELLCWSRGDTGVIGVIQTARHCRKMGMASYLIESARLYFEELGMRYMSFDVWRASPGCRHLAENAGFTDYKLIEMYPEMV